MVACKGGAPCSQHVLISTGHMLRVLTAQACHARTASEQRFLSTEPVANPCRFDPERFLPPRSEGTAGGLEGFMLAFGAEDSFNSHACGGKDVAIAFLLAFTARVCQVTASVRGSVQSAKHLQLLASTASCPITCSGSCCTAERQQAQVSAR